MFRFEMVSLCKSVVNQINLQYYKECMRLLHTRWTFAFANIENPSVHANESDASFFVCEHIEHDCHYLDIIPFIFLRI